MSRALSRNVTFDAANRHRCERAAPSRADKIDCQSRGVLRPDLAEGLDYRDTVTDFTLPEGTFFDTAVVHVLTTATLDRLRELYPQGRFEARRFRPNMVVQTPEGERTFVEDAWIGKVVAIGETVRLKITGSCPRCVMTTLPQGDLPKDVRYYAQPPSITAPTWECTHRCCRAAGFAAVIPSCRCETVTGEHKGPRVRDKA